MLFQKYPKINYKDNYITNISTRLVIPQHIKDNSDLYFIKSIDDKDTPESLAYDYYGKTSYGWVIIMMNDIIDPFFDWLLSYEEIVSYANEKYLDSQATHHWIFQDENYYYDKGEDSFPVSNLAYEIEKNEEKRLIKILYPEYIVQLEREVDFAIRLSNG